MSKDLGDVLASEVYRIVCEGEEGGWVSGLPPDAATRLTAAVDAFCLPGDEGPRVPIARQITRRIREVAKTWDKVPEQAKTMYGVTDFIAAEFDPGHLDGRPPWEQPR